MPSSIANGTVKTSSADSGNHLTHARRPAVDENDGFCGPLLSCLSPSRHKTRNRSLNNELRTAVSPSSSMEPLHTIESEKAIFVVGDGEPEVPMPDATSKTKLEANGVEMAISDSAADVTTLKGEVSTAEVSNSSGGESANEVDYESGLHDPSLRQAAKAMKEEVNKLIAQLDGQDRKQFAAEMDGFLKLFARYLSERASGEKLVWSKIRSPAPDQIKMYNDLPGFKSDSSADYLSKLAVLKLNGGLGTTMGCVGPKSVIEVKDGLTFLDLTVKQIEHLNARYKCNVPLVLMNSFNTDIDTRKIIQKYHGRGVQILTFNQSRFPRVIKESLTPMAASPNDDIGKWYPPGHGDLYAALKNSGLLDQLISMGKEYLFVSNVDNLGATVDTKILDHFAECGAEFVMELTDKTKADVKGGTLVDYDGNVRLLEIAQVPSEHLDDFKSIKKFKIFNTNNLWISLPAIKRHLDTSALPMEIIVNQKTVDSGVQVLQLETAVGAAIKHFNGAHGINVPRSRFLPVKSTSDLFLITSDLYTLLDGELAMSPLRQFSSVPIVKLGDHFKKVAHFLSRFKSAPHILELDHLTVTGDVTFGTDVMLRGTVIIVANHGERIDIPSGSILDDKIVSGNLRILDH